MSCPPTLITDIPHNSVLHLTLVPDPADPSQFRSFADFQTKPIGPGAKVEIERWPHDDIVFPRVKTRTLRAGNDYALDPIRVVFNSADTVKADVTLKITFEGETIFEETLCPCEGKNGVTCTSSALIVMTAGVK